VRPACSFICSVGVSRSSFLAALFQKNGKYFGTSTKHEKHIEEKESACGVSTTIFFFRKKHHTTKSTEL
jgi:hypothetical protein